MLTTKAPTGKSREWHHACVRGAPVEYLLFEQSTKIGDTVFVKGDVFARDPETKTPIGGYKKDDFWKTHVADIRDRDHATMLRVYLFQLMGACDRVLTEQGTVPTAEVWGDKTTAMLKSCQADHGDGATSLRVMAGAMHALLTAMEKDGSLPLNKDKQGVDNASSNAP